MAIPTLVGESGRFSGINAQDVSWPTGHAAGDLGILWIETANQAVPATPTGWTQISSSPVGTGTAGAVGAVRLTLFWKIAASGAEPTVNTGDSGDHNIAGMVAFRGVNTSTPINASLGGTNASSTSVTAGGVTTTVADCAVAVFVANAIDLSSSAQISGWANASLATPAIAEVFDWNGANGTGGGVGLAWGGKATAGVVGGTTATLASASAQAWITVAIAPTPVSSPANVNPGFGDLILTGFAPTVGLSATVIPGFGQLLLDGFAPQITSGPTLSPGFADLILDGFAPTIGTPVTLSPGFADLILTGFLPLIAADGRTVVPDVGSLVLTGFAPTVAVPLTITPGVGQLSLDGFEPTVSVQTAGGGWVEFDIIVDTVLGTTFNFRWAQLVSNVQPLTAKGGSYLEYTKIS